MSYWLSNFIWDFVNFLIPCFASALIVLAYDNPNFVGDNFGALLLSFLLYGLSIIPFTYICSFFFTSASTAQNVMIMVYLVGGVILVNVNFALYMVLTRSLCLLLLISSLLEIYLKIVLRDAWLDSKHTRSQQTLHPPPVPPCAQLLPR